MMLFSNCGWVFIVLLVWLVSFLSCESFNIHPLGVSRVCFVDTFGNKVFGMKLDFSQGLFVAKLLVFL